jgi:hypothetical protein
MNALLLANHRYDFMEAEMGWAIQDQSQGMLIGVLHHQNDRPKKIGVVHEG